MTREILSRKAFRDGGALRKSTGFVKVKGEARRKRRGGGRKEKGKETQKKGDEEGQRMGTEKWMRRLRKLSPHGVYLSGDLQAGSARLIYTPVRL